MSSTSVSSELTKRRWRWWHFALLSLVAWLAFAPFDASIARLCYTYEPSEVVQDLLTVFADISGGGLGVAILIVVIMLVDRARFAKLPMLLAASLGAGLLADILKLFVHRWRPHSMDLTGATFATTFGFPFHFMSANSRGQSFPSGHAATAFGFAIALAYIYPRARWPLIIIAALTSIARVMLHAHFPSDVIAGALLGATWALVCQSPSFASTFARWGEHLDRKLPSGWSKLDSSRAIAVSSTHQHDASPATSREAA